MVHICCVTVGPSGSVSRPGVFPKTYLSPETAKSALQKRLRITAEDYKRLVRLPEHYTSPLLDDSIKDPRIYYHIRVALDAKNHLNYFIYD